MGAMVPPSRKSCYNFRVVEINRVVDLYRLAVGAYGGRGVVGMDNGFIGHCNLLSVTDF